jgi:hypothetical protein
MDLCAVRTVDSNYCIAHWSRVFVIVWRRETTMSAVDDLQRNLVKFAAENPKAGILTIVERNAPLPPSLVRQRLAEILTSVGSSIQRSAVVFEGEGFRAAAVRGVVTGLTMLARPPYPHKVFATVDEAFGWLATGLEAAPGKPLDPLALKRAIGQLRDGLASPAVAG